MATSQIKTIHENTRRKTFVQFRVISWIVLVPAGKNTKPDIQWINYPDRLNRKLFKKGKRLARKYTFRFWRSSFDKVGHKAWPETSPPEVSANAERQPPARRRAERSKSR